MGKYSFRLECMQPSLHSKIDDILDSKMKRSELSEVVGCFLEGRSLAELTEAGLSAKIFERLLNINFQNYQNCLLFLDAILPRLPLYVEEVLNIDEGETETKHQLKIDSAHELEEFADVCWVPFVKLHRSSNNSHNQLHHRVFFKMLHAVSAAKLTEEGMLIHGDIFMDMRIHLCALCLQMNRVGLAIAITLSKKLPGAIISNFINAADLYLFRKMCKLSKEIKSFYEKHDLERQMFDRCKPAETYLDLLGRFEAGEMRSIVEFIDHLRFDKMLVNPCLVGEIFIEHLSPRLGQFLQDAYEDDARTFLEMVINFEWTAAGQYRYDARRFEKLVKFVIHIIDILSYEIPKLSDIHVEVDGLLRFKLKNCDCLIDYSIGSGGIYPDLLASMMILLYRLYRLNSDWHRWFDIITADPLLNRHFLDQGIFSGFPPSSVSWLFLKMCPAVVEENYKFDLVTKNSLSFFFYVAPEEVTVRRQHLFDDFLKRSSIQDQVCHYEPFDVTFDGEMGSGFGITKEFFTLLSKEFQRHDLDMWLGEPRAADRHEIIHFGHDSSPPLYTFSPGGLFPKKNASERSLSHFYYFGQMMARVFVEKCIIDVPLSIELFKYLFAKSCDGFTRKYFDVARIMPHLANFIKNLLRVRRQKLQIRSRVDITEERKRDLIGNLEIEDGCTFDQLDVSFVVPGTDVEMRENGASIRLDPFNVEEYLDCLGEVVMNLDRCPPSSSVKEAFRRGFDAIFPIDDLVIYTPEELQVIFCGDKHEDWTVEHLQSCIMFEQGYDANSLPIEYLLNVMSTFNKSEKRLFSRFVTGEPNITLRLALVTVAKTKFDGDVDHRLPYAATCTNTLFLPEYSSIEIMRDRLMLAITEGCGSFGYA